MNLSTPSTNETRNHQVDMESNRRLTNTWACDRARLAIYQFLSLATVNPQAERWQRILDPDFQELASAAVKVIQDDAQACPDRLAPGELPLTSLDLAPLLTFLRRPRDELIEEFNQVFGLLISRECPPYETEYCPQTFSVYRAQHLADIAGFYRAFGLQPSSRSPERQDHISLELEFMAWLNAKTLYAFEQSDKDNENLCRDAQVRFFGEHLAWWTTAFALAVRKKADGIEDERELNSPPGSLQGALGAFLAAFVPAERGILGISPPTALTSVTEDHEEGCEACPLSADTNFE